MLMGAGCCHAWPCACKIVDGEMTVRLAAALLSAIGTLACMLPIVHPGAEHGLGAPRPLDAYEPVCMS